jgi:VWFA-related protein
MRFHHSASELPAGSFGMRFLLAFAIIAVLVAGVRPANALAGEDPTKPNLITVDVFVADNLGHPVHGLDQQSFTLTDNGQSRQLVSFRAVDPAAQPEALHVLLVVDMLNNTVTEVDRQREQIGEFLNQDGGKLTYPTGLAVLTETGVKMMNGYSQDGHALQEAFQKINTQIRPVGRDAGFYGAAERFQESLNGLQQIAAFEAGQPGRKLVFLIGPGWPLLMASGYESSDRQRAWVFNTLVEISNKLREAHVVLYSLDPFGLGVAAGHGDPFYYESYRKPVIKVTQAEYPYLAQQILAEHSGGRALISSNDTRGDINSALRDAGAYYQLTFEAPAPAKPNEYHKLEVHVDKQNAQAHTNAGYYAQPTMAGKSTPPEKVPAPDLGFPGKP